MQPTTQPKKGNSQTSKVTDTSSRAIPATNEESNQDKSKQADKQDYQGEGDEREWQAPDVNPRYPTDVQASSKSTQTNMGDSNKNVDSDTSLEPSQHEMVDFAMSQDEDDGLLGTEHPGFMNRH